MTLYEFTDDTPADTMQRFITQGESSESTPVVYFVGEGLGLPIADTQEVAAFVRSTSGYFAKIISQSGNWALEGKAPGVFSGYLQTKRITTTKVKWTGATPNNNLPCAYVFKLCTTCAVSEEATIPKLKAFVDMSKMKTGKEVVDSLKKVLGI